jgi:hypothetical protein
MAPFVRGAAYVGFAMVGAVIELYLSKIVASLLGTELFEGTLLVAFGVFIASQWYFWKKFNRANARTLEYVGILLAMFGFISVFYVSGDHDDFISRSARAYARYQNDLSLLLEQASSHAEDYNRQFCKSSDRTPKSLSPDTSVTCDLVRKTKDFLSRKSEITANETSHFIIHNIVAHNLGGRIQHAGFLDLEAFIPRKESPPEIAEFNVLYNYLDVLARLSREAERIHNRMQRPQWVQFLESGEKRGFAAWTSFNSLIMQLGAALVR